MDVLNYFNNNLRYIFFSKNRWAFKLYDVFFHFQIFGLDINSDMVGDDMSMVIKIMATSQFNQLKFIIFFEYYNVQFSVYLVWLIASAHF